MNLSPDLSPDSGLPPRKETFLARYPRKLKLAVTGGILVVLLAPLFLPWAPSKPPEATPAPVVTESQSAAASRVDMSPPPAATGSESAPTAESLAAAARNDTDDHGTRMARAPDPGLTEDTAEGSLPRVGEDGRMPWQVYARPFDKADRRPRIAIVVNDLGLARVATDTALQSLPANVTLAFDVQGAVVGSWMGRARQDGHETLLALPMEPFDYPRSDPGPNTLLTNLPNVDNLQRLNWSLRQGSGYVGVTSLTGSRFTTDPNKFAPVLDVLKQRGLLVLDARAAPHSVVKDLARRAQVPTATATLFIDPTPTPEAIDAALSQLELAAQQTGRAIGIASSLPMTVDRLELWIKQLPSRGIALAPLSAMVE